MPHPSLFRSVLVCGAPNSSNSNRLRELAEREGVEAYLVDGADEIDPQWLEGRHHIGVTAGASAPDILVQGVIERLHALGAGAGVRDLSESGRASGRERVCQYV